MNNIFVFGSNLAGRHGAGAARDARIMYGAKWGVGEGRTGMAYAIPTKDRWLNVRPLEHIRESVNRFIRYANDNPDLVFLVTPIGTGRARYKHKDIAPLFANAPNNCVLPAVWHEWLSPNRRYWAEV